MQPLQKIESIASAATSIAGIAAGHLDRTWRKMMYWQGAFADEHCFRLMSGETHALGTIAIFCGGAGAQATGHGVAPRTRFANQARRRCECLPHKGS